MTAVSGTIVDIVTSDGTADAYLTHPNDHAAHPAVLLYMDAFGVRPSLTRMADRLAEHGYTVLVPNVLYRHGRAPVVDLPVHITDTRRRALLQQLFPLVGELTPERAMRDADAYLSWLTACPRTTDGPVAITGYCVGAALALRTAGAFPDRVAAAAGFHGGNLATDAPDSPHLVADRITAELYFGHADEDPSMPLEQIERLDTALTLAGIRYQADVYSGARHGYTQADTHQYNAEASARHWTMLLALLDRTSR
ncbi:dienelactone hydrolase family protein [Actinoallomurus sp. NBC_01490]|uniref:dienelactone hydrolase family protein n=1 Tax=Actinoallomurus sp. NBC_01490 TaxID=2903557 RepID=UPI002E36B60E|nr:dienelactone hydrolase family protein [Actinoallomurus sp. NBC_01490]